VGTGVDTGAGTGTGAGTCASKRKAVVKASNSVDQLMVRCNFPEQTHTSIMVKAADGLSCRLMLGARMARRQLVVNECVLQAANGEVIGWESAAFGAAEKLATAGSIPVLHVVRRTPPPLPPLPVDAAANDVSELVEANALLKKVDAVLSNAYRHSVGSETGSELEGEAYPTPAAELDGPVAKAAATALGNAADADADADAAAVEGGRRENQVGPISHMLIISEEEVNVGKSPEPLLDSEDKADGEEVGKLQSGAAGGGTRVGAAAAAPFEVEPVQSSEDGNAVRRFLDRLADSGGGGGGGGGRAPLVPSYLGATAVSPLIRRPAVRRAASAVTVYSPAHGPKPRRSFGPTRSASHRSKPTPRCTQNEAYELTKPVWVDSPKAAAATNPAIATLLAAVDPLSPQIEFATKPPPRLNPTAASSSRSTDPHQPNCGSAEAKADIGVSTADGTGDDETPVNQRITQFGGNKRMARSLLGSSTSTDGTECAVPLKRARKSMPATLDGGGAAANVARASAAGPGISKLADKFNKLNADAVDKSKVRHCNRVPSTLEAASRANEPDDNTESQPGADGSAVSKPAPPQRKKVVDRPPIKSATPVRQHPSRAGTSASASSSTATGSGTSASASTGRATLAKPPPMYKRVDASVRNSAKPTKSTRSRVPSAKQSYARARVQARQRPSGDPAKDTVVVRRHKPSTSSSAAAAATTGGGSSGRGPRGSRGSGGDVRDESTRAPASPKRCTKDVAGGKDQDGGEAADDASLASGDKRGSQEIETSLRPSSRLRTESSAAEHASPCSSGTGTRRTKGKDGSSPSASSSSSTRVQATLSRFERKPSAAKKPAVAKKPTPVSAAAPVSMSRRRERTSSVSVAVAPTEASALKRLSIKDATSTSSSSSSSSSSNRTSAGAGASTSAARSSNSTTATRSKRQTTLSSKIDRFGGGGRIRVPKGKGKGKDSGSRRHTDV
jgi:hypothetical protein